MLLQPPPFPRTPYSVADILNYAHWFNHSTPMKPPLAGVAAALVVVLALPGAAQTLKAERESLRGIQGVRVIVESLPEDADEIDLDRTDLEREIAYRFKRAGIDVLSQDELEADERQPYLYVNCNVLYVPDIKLTSFSIDVELHQTATLKSGQESAVLTWARSFLGIQHRDRAAPTIRTRMGELIEQFIDDYHAVNAARKI